jgi:sodium/bile acid cotransporter 7
MGSFLARHWFLILLPVGICLALVQTAAVRAVVGPIPTRAVVAGTLFLMGWSLESRQLWRAVTRPLPVLWALAVTYGLLPCLGWLAYAGYVALGFPDYGIGILVSTAVPCTLASAVLWTRLAGGNDATALLVTVLTVATSWLVTTAWLTVATGTEVGVDAQAMVGDLVFFLIVPVALGQLARWPASLRQLAVRGKITLGIVSQLLIFLIILQAVVLAAERLRGSPVTEQAHILLLAGLICMAIHLAGLCVGYWGGKVLSLDHRDRVAIAFAGSQKTLPIGLLLVNTYFSRYALAVVPLLFYHVGQLLVDTWIADRFRNEGRRMQPIPPYPPDSDFPPLD